MTSKTVAPAPATSPAKPSTATMWHIDDMNRLHRTLCLGAGSGTYTCEDSPLSKDWGCLTSLIADQRGVEVVKVIKDFSINGRTAKQPPLLMALAVCARSTDMDTKQAAFAALPDICRIPTYLFLFVKYVEDLGKDSKPTSSGWGRALRKAVSSWYTTREPKQLATFLTKYRQRSSWSHKDLLRLSHTNPRENQALTLLLKYVKKGWKKTQEDYADDGTSDELKALLTYLDDVETVKHADKENSQKVAALIEKHHLVREHVPTWLLKSKEIWRALLQHMSLEALVRSLNKLSSLGLLDSTADDNCIKLVVDKLQNPTLLKDSRLHPMNILLALESYNNGCGEKGKKLKWIPNIQIKDALEQAFYATFKNVEATNKRYLLCVDASKSMEYGSVHGASQLKPIKAAAAMAMVTGRTESNFSLMAFSSKCLTLIDVDTSKTIQEVCHAFSEVEMGGTDCAAPMQWALDNKKAIDVFIVYTDCDLQPTETHPADVLRKYRDDLGIKDARLVVCSLANTKFTIADPDDAGMLDIAGFDSAVPQIIQNFVLGRL